MHAAKATPKEASIQLLNIVISDEHKLLRIFNRIWFFYKLNFANGASDEAAIITRLQSNQPRPLIDLFVTDLTDQPQNKINEFLQTGRMAEIVDLLKKSNIPLISLYNGNELITHVTDQKWLHIHLPNNQIERYIDAINDAITNFWFEVPTHEFQDTTNLARP